MTRKTQTLALPGATVTYDVREAERAGAEPVLLMIGSPMDASGFTMLAGHFPDRTVVLTTREGWGAARGPTVSPRRLRMRTRRTCTA
jgi:hypothetical protein